MARSLVLVALMGTCSATSGCAEAPEGWADCARAQRPLTGDLELDLQGTWAGLDDLEGAMLHLRPDGTFTYVDRGVAPQQGRYAVGENALRLCHGQDSRQERVRVGEASLEVLVGDEQGPLRFARVECWATEVAADPAEATRSAHRPVDDTRAPVRDNARWSPCEGSAPPSTS